MARDSALRRGRVGFTLIEILVVLGIIIILISLLIPVISSVRKQARKASTQQEMSRIQSAITSYLGDWHANPGPFSEDQVYPANQTAVPAFPLTPTCPDPKTGTALTGLVGANVQVTSTENLFLGLEGGINYATTPAFTYDPTKVKLGPSNLNPLLPKQHNAYVDFGDDETTITGDAASGLCSNLNNSFLNGKINSPAAATDSSIPEFIDHFTPAMPILYLRARSGRTGVVTTPTAGNTAVQQYDISQLAPYNFTVSTVNTSDYPQGSNLDCAVTYFSNPAVPGSPRGKDGFILISAGPDGIYGTADDIIVSN